MNGEFIPGGVKTQLAAEIFTRSMTSMKNMLKQAEDRYDGKIDCDGYKWYKGFVMDQFYIMFEDQFRIMYESFLIEECKCGASIHKRNGWKPCGFCSGSGYKNSKKYNEFLCGFEKKLIQ